MAQLTMVLLLLLEASVVCFLASASVLKDKRGMSCVYKGQIYQQQQTWDDGCDYTCTCVDSSRGMYRCTSKCLKWQLPDSCTMDPPPAGKCCPVPRCPPYIKINWPPGYVPA